MCAAASLWSVEVKLGPDAGSIRRGSRFGAPTYTSEPTDLARPRLCSGDSQETWTGIYPCWLRL